MGQSNAVVKRVDVGDGVSNLSRIKMLLLAAGFRSVAAWAKHRKYNASMVFHSIMGTRCNARTADIIARLAEDVGKPLHVIQQLVPDRHSAQHRADALEVSHAGNGSDDAR